MKCELSVLESVQVSERTGSSQRSLKDLQKVFLRELRPRAPAHSFSEVLLQRAALEPFAASRAVLGFASVCFHGSGSSQRSSESLGDIYEFRMRSLMLLWAVFIITVSIIIVPSLRESRANYLIHSRLCQRDSHMDISKESANKLCTRPSS